ncbi:glycosyltransferase [Patescibacteria group bacterium]|nr:glycosyltransferase [Patescibacteria group bacterium]MBU1501082.1 glycosyltransferase [Patescibacteria group bacterium]MBU2081045.1 glycosyltransferase [Patescibacteria group bacterium]MBU2124136.1 glycosyltransferase [Patescibacteria group bacterium]MBU2194992.1 glycosyltransferase [Patescibacteria group bacterium]
MSFEILAYPFIFLGLYFEVFMLLTFLSPAAKERRQRKATEETPRVAIIVPCWNEEDTIGGTVESLLALEYPSDKLQIILVDDGSTDNTRVVMDSYTSAPQVTVLHKKNEGKHTAINAGIALAEDAEFIGCLDADSFVAPNALKEIIPCFFDEKVAAATPAMSVHQPKNFLEQMQNTEYIIGIALRHTLSAVNGIYVTPGPFSFYRRSVIDELGGFRHAHQAEDMEMALRMQRAGYEIENAPRARVFTRVPRSVPKLVKQRTRWTTGFLRNVMTDYRDLVGNPHYGILGLMVLPLGFVAIVGGVFLFVVALVAGVVGIVERIIITSGVPLSYTLVPRFSPEWFYTPITFLLLSSVVVGVLSISLVLIGRNVSQTPAKVFLGIIGYTFVYALIAPFWLLRALFDVLTGRRRAWR